MYKTCWYIIITYEFEYKSGNSSHRYRRIPVTDCIMMSSSTRPIACKSDIYSCTDLIQLSSHASWYKTSTKPNAIQALAFNVEYLFLYKTSAEHENPKTNRLPNNSLACYSKSQQMFMIAVLQYIFRKFWSYLLFLQGHTTCCLQSENLCVSQQCR